MIRLPKIKRIVSVLQEVKSFESPLVSLEQHQTPPELAAELLALIYSYDDIQDKVVLDLGCGTGIFGLGCVYLGASRVIGVDVDPAAIDLARQNAEELELSQKDDQKISFIVGDVTRLTTGDDRLKGIDTVIMNPPFGTKKEIHIDYEFVHIALQFANKVYSLHKSSTRKFWEKKVNWNVTVLKKDIPFCISKTFKCHKEKEGYTHVDLLCHSK